jgi:tetratricopeptide (TPR) repeat protein
MRRHFAIIICCYVCAGFLTSTAAQELTNASTASPREQIQQLTLQLRQSPGDQALRKKIIALALTMNPGPATPDDAIMAEGAAEYAFKNAKASSDFSDAAKQYEKALVLAPWLAADYFNCGVAHEKAGEIKEAIQSFSHYLLAAPDANDSLAVKKRIGGLQYAEQRQSSAQAEKEAEAKAQVAEAARKEAEIRIGAHYGGGIIFYVDGTGQHGLIAAIEDQGRGNWYDAVNLCRNYRGGGYTDWFMPSNSQIRLLYSQKNAVGGFRQDSNAYWSSTEGAGGAAYNGVSSVIFRDTSDWRGFDGNLMTNASAKYAYNDVRAIRTF